MSIIIRLQNLPWSAGSVDIRQYFSGLSIPVGGIHIVGGEMGDAFIAFGTDEDARLAMGKNGGKIKDMQIKLLLSSRMEMLSVIQQAWQQNTRSVQPAKIPTQFAVLPMQQFDRHKIPSAGNGKAAHSEIPHLESSKGSLSRDRRPSPDRCSSKRDQSMNSIQNRHDSNKDTDCRNNRFETRKRRFDELSSYRDEFHSKRNVKQDIKKFPDTNCTLSITQIHINEEFRNMDHEFYDTATSVTTDNYSKCNPQSSENNEDYPNTLYNLPSIDQISLIQPNDYTGTQKSDFSAVKTALISAGQQSLLHETSVYEQRNRSGQGKAPRFLQKNVQSYEQKNTSVHEERSATNNQKNTVTFHQRNAPPYEQRIALSKDIVPLANINQQFTQLRTRFEPELETSQQNRIFSPSECNKVILPETPLDSPSNKTNQTSLDPRSVSRNTSPRQTHGYSKNLYWAAKREKLLPPPPISNNSDFVQVIPLEPDATLDVPVEESEYARPDEQQKGSHLLPRVTNSFPKGNSSLRSNGVPEELSNRNLPNDHQHLESSLLTIEVSGPPNFRVKDILKIFHGIPLSPSNIQIRANVPGEEKAFVRFSNSADFEKALTIHKSGEFEITPCLSSEFDNAVRFQISRPQSKPCDEDLCVKLQGLPFFCKEDDVLRFFNGLGILDLFIDMRPDRKTSGVGFVQFGTPEDLQTALTMNGKMIGRRYITVSVASKEMMILAKGKEYVPLPPRVMSPLQYLDSPQLLDSSRPIGSSQNQFFLNQNRNIPFCISIRGLPECVTSRDIADFFSQVNIIPRAIHIMLSFDERPSGDGFVEFASRKDFETAMMTNGKRLLGNRLTLMAVPFSEMSEVLRRPVLLPPPDIPLLRTPSKISMPPRHLPQGPFRERPRRELPIHRGRLHMEPYSCTEVPGRAPFTRMHGPIPFRHFGPEDRFPLPFARKSAPGCIVSINNLHFRAGLEELLDFFNGYYIIKDSIIRKYNENGQTTGEARVTFKNLREAQKAVRELNQKPIMGRSLSLSIL